MSQTMKDTKQLNPTNNLREIISTLTRFQGAPRRLSVLTLSRLCYGPVVTYYMVYHYTKRVPLARLLANKGPVIYVVYLNRYFVIPP